MTRRPVLDTGPPRHSAPITYVMSGIFVNVLDFPLKHGCFTAAPAPRHRDHAWGIETCRETCDVNFCRAAIRAVRPPGWMGTDGESASVSRRAPRIFTLLITGPIILSRMASRKGCRHIRPTQGRGLSPREILAITRLCREGTSPSPTTREGSARSWPNHRYRTRLHDHGVEGNSNNLLRRQHRCPTKQPFRHTYVRLATPHQRYATKWMLQAGYLRPAPTIRRIIGYGT